MKSLVVAIICITSIGMAYAETPSTSGFIPGSIWYSQEPLVQGDKVLIHTAVWNGDDQPLSARVEFYDKNVILGTRDVVVEKNSLKDVSISWQVTAGDHVISAKILSSTLTNGTKKEQIVLDRNTTTQDRRFVPVVVKSVDGTPASSSDVVKSQVDKATSKIGEIVPDSLSSSFGSLDTFRDETYTQIVSQKEETKKYIEAKEKVSGTQTNSKPLDSTEKPIAYIKLFLLSIVGFIFGNTLVFYGIIAVIIFFLGRLLYRKIRNR
jgi:hypothetical protein